MKKRSVQPIYYTLPGGRMSNLVLLYDERGTLSTILNVSPKKLDKIVWAMRDIGVEWVVEESRIVPYHVAVQYFGLGITVDVLGVIN